MLMPMKNALHKIYRNRNTDAAALILRLFIAAVFIMAGWTKVTNMEMVVGFFTQMGFSSFQAYLVSWVELLGGILVLLGVFQKPVLTALGVICTVIVFSTPDAPMNTFLGHDYVVSLFVMIIALYFTGPGKYSIAGWRERRQSRA